MEYKFKKVEVLKFRNGDNVATIATNGIMHVTKEYELLKEHGTQHHAIGYLEAKELEGFWDLVTIKPIEDVMEKKICLWLLSPCTQKNLEGKSEVCERYGVAFAMEFDSSFFPVSL